ncbi:unnamed protein product [Rotaria sordida]|uniref:Uncharacterized protein n=1 Tax=Rotaria sordida TaxID=392033 RepID=A0A814VRI5_9BILA|nr:unnamed protein product [Rotaria sordida]CAF1590016.1 unnamed protein product [Rotaria sordida]
MSNLEKLSLYFVYDNGRIIDGDKLKKNILNYMTRLNKFTFDIYSIIRHANQIKIPSNEDIQYTFRNFKNNQIISGVNYFPEANECHCHIYSYPYTLIYYHNITNNFSDGLFKSVGQNCSIISIYLTELDLVRTHENYVEEFLIDSKTRLLNNITLHITYESSQRVTYNFTRDATRINCSKIDCIVLYSESEVFQYSKDYFPNAKILPL